MYSPEERAKAIETVIAGLRKGTPLTVLCSAEGMPHPSTWRDWCDADETLAIAYARARDDGFDAIAAEGLAILDEEPERVVVTTGEERTETRIDSAAVAWAKNRFEGRMKLLAKWDPKRYGDATTVKHADADGGQLPMDEVGIATRAAALIANALARDDAGAE